MFAVLAGWMIYRRFRRNFGRQLLRPRRIAVRMLLLVLLTVSLLPAALRAGAYLRAEAMGAAVGVALALWGASRTRFVKDGDRLFYIPHSYTGVAVSALVLARLVYRLVELYSAGGLPVPGTEPPDVRGAMVKTPLTLGLLFVLTGYYLCYYGRVLWKSRRLTAADIEASAPPEGGATDTFSSGQVKEGNRQETSARQQHIVAPTGDQT
ncbi:MAG TPA: hypothetical protein VHY75_16305 [Steroidobacteraceae bacterium]|jgi:hypothetical protein|nr:hypothetical protein [Steroidobacteraceae bacterium]